jgi:hypothetical protein
VTFKARHVLFEGGRRESSTDGQEKTPAPVAATQAAAATTTGTRPPGEVTGTATADDLPF